MVSSGGGIGMDLLMIMILVSIIVAEMRLDPRVCAVDGDYE